MKNDYFTRIAENKAKEISTQVTLGVLSEVQKSLASVDAQLQNSIPEEHLPEVTAEVERALRTRGVYANFNRKEYSRG